MLVSDTKDAYIAPDVVSREMVSHLQPYIFYRVVLNVKRKMENNKINLFSLSTHPLSSFFFPYLLLRLAIFFFLYIKHQAYMYQQAE